MSENARYTDPPLGKEELVGDAAHEVGFQLSTIRNILYLHFHGETEKEQEHEPAATLLWAIHIPG